MLQRTRCKSVLQCSPLRKCCLVCACPYALINSWTCGCRRSAVGDDDRRARLGRHVAHTGVLVYPQIRMLTGPLHFGTVTQA